MLLRSLTQMRLRAKMQAPNLFYIVLLVVVSVLFWRSSAMTRNLGEEQAVLSAASSGVRNIALKTRG